MECLSVTPKNLPCPGTWIKVFAIGLHSNNNIIIFTPNFDLPPTWVSATMEGNPIYLGHWGQSDTVADTAPLPTPKVDRGCRGKMRKLEHPIFVGGKISFFQLISYNLTMPWNLSYLSDWIWHCRHCHAAANNRNEQGHERKKNCLSYALLCYNFDLLI